MNKDPAKNYRQVQIETATQEQLILLMYEHAVRSVRSAREALPTKKYDTVSNHIIKAQDIITELMVSLKMEAGPIAQNLYRLYDYMNRRLIEANMKKNVDALVEVEKMLSALLSTWDEAIKKMPAQAERSTQSGPAQRPAMGGFSISG